MSKILCVGDIHFGSKNNSTKFNQQIIEFIDWICDLKNSHDFDKVIIFGDYYEERNKINVETLNFGVKGARILGECYGKDHVFILTGNHDLFFRDSLCTSSLISVEPYVTVVNKLTSLDNILLSPWIISQDMWEEVVNESKNHDYLYAHLELNGFMVNDAYEMEHGFSPKELRDYKMVCSGHYHSAQKKGNIQYLGTPYPITMNEANQEHGVWIHDTAKNKLEFIKYDKIKVVSIPYTLLEEVIDDLDPDNTSIRIEFPDDLDDETLITDVQELLSSKNFSEAKIKYKGNKIKELLDVEIESLEAVENMDELVVKTIRDSKEIDGIDKGLLEFFYKEAILKNTESKAEQV